ncbi:MAG: tRNA (adenosine(37)-N6)-dimethylallyltransferase MiaA [Planctomycetota bacterium]
MSRLYFILGCTAGGKSALGRALAAQLGGQIISVDSMKIYRRMDIGTAKPSAEARAKILHHCIDLVEPWESFSVAQFVEAADAAVEQVRQAGAIPLAVGGTSLYIKALSEGLFEGPGADDQLRAELAEQAERHGLASLHAQLAEVDPEAAGRIHPNDRKRIFRALEVWKLTGRAITDLQQQWDDQPDRYECVFIGLARDKAEGNRRINRRVKKMVEMGLLDEVKTLWEDPRGISAPAAQAVGYAEIIEHLEGRCSFDSAVERIKINTRRLAKKQRTWQRRFRHVQWFDVAAEQTPEHLAERVLAEVDFR